jgi:hypothetical protein
LSQSSRPNFLEPFYDRRRVEPNHGSILFRAFCALRAAQPFIVSRKFRWPESNVLKHVVAQIQEPLARAEMSGKVTPRYASRLIDRATQHRRDVLDEEDILIREPCGVSLTKRGVSLKQPIGEIGEQGLSVLLSELGVHTRQNYASSLASASNFGCNGLQNSRPHLSLRKLIARQLWKRG